MLPSPCKAAPAFRRCEVIMRWFSLCLVVAACASSPKKDTSSSDRETPKRGNYTPVDVDAINTRQAPADVAAPPKDANFESSGLASVVLVPGTGTQHPGPTSEVEVHYTGWQTDGNMFDSSTARGETATFPLDRVIKGWTEG